MNKGLQILICKPLILLVGAAGFELATLCSQSRCATRLRYAPWVLTCPDRTRQKRVVLVRERNATTIDESALTVRYDCRHF